MLLWPRTFLGGRDVDSQVLVSCDQLTEINIRTLADTLTLGHRDNPPVPSAGLPLQLALGGVGLPVRATHLAYLLLPGLGLRTLSASQQDARVAGLGVGGYHGAEN